MKLFKLGIKSGAGMPTHFVWVVAKSIAIAIDSKTNGTVDSAEFISNLIEVINEETNIDNTTDDRPGYGGHGGCTISPEYHLSSN